MVRSMAVPAEFLISITPVSLLFLLVRTIVPVEGGEGMAFWRDKLFVELARNATDMTDFLSIPPTG